MPVIITFPSASKRSRTAVGPAPTVSGRQHLVEDATRGLVVRDGRVPEDLVAGAGDLEGEERAAGLLAGGVLPAPERLPSGYRVSGSATVERIRLARRLQALGLTLEEIVDALHSTDRGTATCASERWRLEAVLERIEMQIAELRAVRKEVRSVLARCDAGRCMFAESASSRP